MAKNTRQRRAVSRAFSTDTPPLTPHEILEAASVNAPSLGIATVYRAVKTMVEEGILTVVELPGQPTRFELADKDHHHFFHCRGCGRLIDVKKCNKRYEQMLPAGFKLERHEVILYGLCDECAK